MNPLANPMISGLGGAPRAVPGFGTQNNGEGAGSSFAALLREQASQTASAPKLNSAPPPAVARPAPPPAPAPRPNEPRESDNKPAESRAASKSSEPAVRKPTSQTGASAGQAKPAQSGSEAELRARRTAKGDTASAERSGAESETTRSAELSDRSAGSSGNSGADGALGALLISTPQGAAQPLTPNGTLGSPISGQGLDAEGSSLQAADALAGDVGGPREPSSRRGAGPASVLEKQEISSRQTAAAQDMGADSPLGLDASQATQEQGQIQLPGGLADSARSSFAARLEQAQTQALETLQGVHAPQGSPASHGASESVQPPAAQLSLSQPLHSPDFAPEMAARVSILTSEGVQRAELHLNPAEMGPVQIQIVVDGQQAQVSFMSDQAETRAVLERSLPELASALRDNGLTLSGGGVFQQQQQRERDGAPSQQGDGGRREPASVEGKAEGLSAGNSAAGSMPRPVTRARGVVDLYA